MSDIKIRIRGDVTHTLAMSLVTEVIEGGRVSNGPAGPCYCHATVFTMSNDSEVVVYAHRTPTMDVFRVLRLGASHSLS